MLDLKEVKEYAIKRHSDQKYGDKPYSYHLSQVADILLEFGFDSKEYQTVAWFHDILEDTPTTFSELEDKFGREIAYYVNRLTDEPGKNRKERKSKTYSKIREFDFTIYVKVADRIANVRNSIKDNRSLFKMYLKEHSEFSKQLKTESTKDHPIWKELDSLFQR